MTFVILILSENLLLLTFLHQNFISGTLFRHNRNLCSCRCVGISKERKQHFAVLYSLYLTCEARSLSRFSYYFVLGR